MWREQLGIGYLVSWGLGQLGIWLFGYLFAPNMAFELCQNKHKRQALAQQITKSPNNQTPIISVLSSTVPQFHANGFS